QTCALPIFQLRDLQPHAAAEQQPGRQPRPKPLLLAVDGPRGDGGGARRPHRPRARQGHDAPRAPAGAEWSAGHPLAQPARRDALELRDRRARPRQGVVAHVRPRTARPGFQGHHQHRIRRPLRPGRGIRPRIRAIALLRAGLMKIDRITCRVVDFPLDREFHPAWARGRNQPNLLMVLIEVDTDDGLTGIGAAHAGLEAAVTIERFVAPYFIGQDPMHVESLVPVLRDTEILGAPVYCMETTLWDIVGKAADEPGHGGPRAWGFAMALTIARELQRMRVRWLEEPLPRHDYDGLRRLRDRLDTLPIAGGEDNHGLHEFKLLIDRGCYDILQPDALLSEGVGQMRKVAALAEVAGLEVAPHTWGNGIGLLANLHLAAAIPNCPFLEFPHDPPSGWTAAARDQ